MVDDLPAGLRLLVLVAQSRWPLVTSPTGGGSLATHRRWGRRPVRGGQGAGVPECGHPLAEQAGRTLAVDAASCVFPAFAHGPVGPPLVVAAMLGV